MLFRIMVSAILTFSTNAFAQQPNTNPSCTAELGEDEKVLIETVKHAKHIRNIFCDTEKLSGLTTTEIDEITAPVFEVSRKELSMLTKLKKVDIIELTQHRLIGVTDHMGQTVVATADLSITRNNGNVELSYFENGLRNVHILSSLQDCNVDCMPVLVRYVRYINQMFSPTDQTILLSTKKELDVLSHSWETYFKDAREQTFIDIAVNSFFYEWELGNKIDLILNGPPKTQWFALHPTIIIESVPDALDGQQTSEAVAFEVMGFNRWQGENGCFGVPCGASVFISYNDRTDVNDKGWGLMFHVGNKYSLGAVKYGEDTGFFITVDLLKLFSDKKSSYEQWKKEVN